MNIFITVGTTPFDRLVRAADMQLGADYKLTFQISEGKYIPKGHDYFRFSDDIDSYFKRADLIISHGGAGTIYKALGLGKRLLVVPNLDRVDHHQLDICNYMVENNYACSCLEFDKLSETLKEACTHKFASYQADTFTGISNIRQFLGLQE